MSKLPIKSLMLTFALNFWAMPLEAELPSKIHLPDLGDSSGRLISPIQEQILGAAFFRSLQAQLTFY